MSPGGVNLEFEWRVVREEGWWWEWGFHGYNEIRVFRNMTRIIIYYYNLRKSS